MIKVVKISLFGNYETQKIVFYKIIHLQKYQNDDFGQFQGVKFSFLTIFEGPTILNKQNLDSYK